jgi:hypothetical protein
MVCDDLLNQEIDIQKKKKTLVVWRWQLLLCRLEMPN